MDRQPSRRTRCVPNIIHSYSPILHSVILHILSFSHTTFCHSPMLHSVILPCFILSFSHTSFSLASFCQSPLPHSVDLPYHILSFPHTSFPRSPDTVLQFILDGLKIQSVASHAAKAVQKVCQKCRKRMAPHFDGLLQVPIPHSSCFHSDYPHTPMFSFTHSPVPDNPVCGPAIGVQRCDSWTPEGSGGGPVSAATRQGHSWHERSGPAAHHPSSRGWKIYILFVFDLLCAFPS